MNSRGLALATPFSNTIALKSSGSPTTSTLMGLPVTLVTILAISFTDLTSPLMRTKSGTEFGLVVASMARRTMEAPRSAMAVQVCFPLGLPQVLHNVSLMSPQPSCVGYGKHTAVCYRQSQTYYDNIGKRTRENTDHFDAVFLAELLGPGNMGLRLSPDRVWDFHRTGVTAKTC